MKRFSQIQRYSLALSSTLDRCALSCSSLVVVEERKKVWQEANVVSLETTKAIMTTKLSAPHFQDLLHQLHNFLFRDPPSAWSRLSGSSVQTSESSPKRALHLRVVDQGPSQCSGVHHSMFCVQGCETDPTIPSHCNVAQLNRGRHLLPLL